MSNWAKIARASGRLFVLGPLLLMLVTTPFGPSLRSGPTVINVAAFVAFLLLFIYADIQIKTALPRKWSWVLAWFMLSVAVFVSCYLTAFVWWRFAGASQGYNVSFILMQYARVSPLLVPIVVFIPSEILMWATRKSIGGSRVDAG